VLSATARPGDELGYANAIRATSRPTRLRFHLFRLGTTVVDGVRLRVQQATRAHR
jgi:hypothetical protein